MAISLRFCRLDVDSFPLLRLSYTITQSHKTQQTEHNGGVTRNVPASLLRAIIRRPTSALDRRNNDPRVAPLIMGVVTRNVPASLPYAIVLLFVAVRLFDRRDNESAPL